MKLKALIADDEPLARERLRYLLSSDEAVEIAGECRNGREVVSALRDASIDVLFLDIQMPVHNGFEALARTEALASPAVVFVTAHPHYAVQAFGIEAIDYLTKPVEAERLSAAVTRVRERLAADRALATQEQLRSVLAGLADATNSERYPTRLLVPNGGKDTFVTVTEIDWVEAADYYCCLHVGPKSFMLRETIKQMACTLDPRKFVRIHRSIIVNVDRVREIFHASRSEGAVVLHSGLRLRMSRKGWQDLIASHGKQMR
ncbi:LytR/AlgR family response regulator transcription factor [Silvibacterium acidisoli]|uniref:LytR/AlgR family response regulator transcription factor n=1 Tax=Acidobacteriaceae bacterium ZG23-2 TaxID=2883246 RepID=UPI00406CAE48